jgi:hypothetical protein
MPYYGSNSQEGQGYYYRRRRVIISSAVIATNKIAVVALNNISINV